MQTTPSEKREGKWISILVTAVALLGSAVSAPACGVAPPPEAPHAAGPADGIALLHRLQDALGGADRIAAIRDFDQMVVGIAIDGKVVRFSSPEPGSRDGTRLLRGIGAVWDDPGRRAGIGTPPAARNEDRYS